MNQPNPPPADAGTLGAFYAFVVRSMDTGFCILEPVRDGAGQTVDFRVVDANPAFEVHSGLNHALGRSLLEMLPDSAGRWIEFLDSAKPGGVPVCLREGSGPFGRRFDVQAIRTGGAAGQVAVLFRNVTQRTLRDLALRRSESRYRRLFESIDEGFCIIEMEFDAQGHPVDYRFLEINPSFERQTGMRGAQGKSMLALAPAHERHWFETYGQVARSGQPIRFQNLASALGRWFDVYAFPAGEPNQVAILFTDISARMRAEQRLKDSDQRKDEFLAMLAHELRNPLAPIGAAAELLERGQLDATLVSQASAIIRRQVRHLTGLVDDLLDVSRVTRGLVTLDCRRVDTKRVLSEAVEQVRPLMEARRHTLTLHTPPDAAWVLGDHERLVQVMTNLLNNAAKYTPLGGQVGLHLEVAKGQVCVTVSDNGIGMEPAFLEAAFELFAQAERSADRSQGGLGIGLALVKRL
ncbi:MAG TPA: PAS domain-containing sensor histidine kinase, partial [Ramlibacter sp.]|nr:PAS domain-containing sensor histidine kinase [Ramlibacter sp.]